MNIDRVFSYLRWTAPKLSPQIQQDRGDGEHSPTPAPLPGIHSNFNCRAKPYNGSFCPPSHLLAANFAHWTELLLSQSGKVLFAELQYVLQQFGRLHLAKQSP